MLKVAVCDDEIQELKHISKLINKHGYALHEQAHIYSTIYCAFAFDNCPYFVF